MSGRLSRASAVVVCLLVLVVVVAFRPGKPLPAEVGEKDAKAPPSPPETAGLEFVIEPYLQFPTRDTIVVMWETNRPGIGSVSYGKSPPLTKKATAEAAATIHEVRLTDLEPNAKYYYQVTTTTEDGKSLPGQLLTFTTAVDADSAFSFTIIGDTQ